jgi:hypothetical protein
MVQIRVHIYVNGKVSPVGSTTGMKRRIKKNDGGDEFMCDIFDIL